MRTRTSLRGIAHGGLPVRILMGFTIMLLLALRSMADVVKVLRLQLTKGTKRTKLLALFLVESLSKNCGMKFLQAMGTAEFMAAFKKIAKVRWLLCGSLLSTSAHHAKVT